jgi:hypothetical protein
VTPIERLALEWLPVIADQLARVKGNSRNGYAGPWEVWMVRPEDLRELGKALRQVAAGANARKVFRQEERKKPTKEREHRAAAVVFWSVCCEHLSARREARVAAAIREVRSKVHACRKLRDSYIERIARNHRDEALRMLEVGAPYVEMVGARIPEPRAIAELKRYLARKTGSSGGRARRENVDE